MLKRLKIYCYRITVTSILLLSPLSVLSQVDLRAAEKAVRTGDYSNAFKNYREAALAGDAEAQYQLANLYVLGRGVKKNDSQALRWLKQSAEQEHAAAQYTLGIKTLDRNSDSALLLISAAAESGYKPAKVYIDRMGSLTENQDLNSTSGDEQWFAAAKKNKLAEMKRILDRGDIDKADNSGRTALFYSIEHDNKNILEWLVVNGANVNHRDNFGVTPLFLAIASERQALLPLMLKEKNVQMNITLPNGDNLLHYSIRRKHFELIPLLLENEIDVNHKNDEGWTPLDLAEYGQASLVVERLKRAKAIHGDSWGSLTQAQDTDRLAKQIAKSGSTSSLELSEMAKIVVSGNVRLFSQLIQTNEQLLDQNFKDGSTLLSLAIKSENRDMLAALLSAGASTNQVVYRGYMPLHIAAEIGSVDIVEQLLRSGADPLVKNDDGLDVMEISIQAKQDSVVSVLLASKNFDKGSVPYGRYLLMASRFEMSDLVKEIASLKPAIFKEVSISDDQGRTPLWFAANNANVDLIQALLDIGFKGGIADKQGRTAFYMAVDTQCFQCARLLFTSSEIDRQTFAGNSALMAAAMESNADITQWLLDSGAKIDLRNKQGNTALIFAVENNAVAVVKVLVEKGANISRKNKLGYSALDIAERKDLDLVSVLKSGSVLGIF